MNLSLYFFLVVVCTMYVAAQQANSQKGCKKFGHSCYGGLGKRSLCTEENDATGMQLNNLHERSNKMVQFYPSEANVIIDGNVEAIPRYKLIEMMKSRFGTRNGSPVAERSAELLNNDSNPATNNNCEP